MKRSFIWICGILAVIVISAVVIGMTAENDYYNYKGYVTDVYENAKGETEIIALSGDVESRFVIKSNTRISSAMEQPVAQGDLVMLTTTRYSDEIIKKMKVQPGYSTEGKLFYVEGVDSPFILTESAVTKARQIVNLVCADDSSLFDITGSGDVIKVFHSSPYTVSSTTVFIDAVLFIENGSREDLTAEDIEYIEACGYTVRTE